MQLRVQNIHFLKYITFILLFIFTVNLAQNTSGVSKKDTLTVGVSGSAPFYFTAENSVVPQGISVEIWEKIADEKDWNYKYQNFTSIKEGLESLKKGELDVLVGPVTITSQRVEHFRFSQPYYQSNLAILYKKGTFSIWNAVKMLFSYKLIIAIGVFLIILTIVGTLLWLAERKASPEQFSSKPASGIGSGMWLAIVTMSTTGYGDKAPVTLAGRIIAGTWMIVSIISATSMVAGIASVLTFTNFQGNEYNSIEQLKGKKVATVSGSPASDFLKEYNTRRISVPTLAEAIKILDAKEIDAIVYDRPQLLFYLSSHKDDDLIISKAEYFNQGYGFAFPLESDLPFEINRSLLKLSEEQQTAEIIEHYLGTKHN